MNDYHNNILEHIEKFGCSVTSVFDPDNEKPPYSYSIGIARSCGAPELIVVGLNQDLGHDLVNVYNDKVQTGKRFELGVEYQDFLEDFPIQFAQVMRKYRERYMLSTSWLYGGPEFEALQLIWPSTSGIWPWQSEAPNWLCDIQPLLFEVSGKES